MKYFQAIQINSTPTIWQNRLSISLTKHRTSLEIKRNLLVSSSSTGTKLSHNQPTWANEELVVISILPSSSCVLHGIDLSIQADPRIRLNNSITSHLTTLAQRLSSNVSSPSGSLTQLPNLTKPAQEKSTSPASLAKMLCCTYSRTPAYFDKNSKKISLPTSGPHGLVPKQEERAIDLWEPADRRCLRDVESVLGECFVGTTTT